jgi:mannose/fructose/N-acetylgalactosamine-specific phosphotransferase system component IID
MQQNLDLFMQRLQPLTQYAMATCLLQRKVAFVVLLHGSCEF